MARSVALTTTDNPFDPIDEYDQWRKYDSVDHDYKTEDYLDRVSHTTLELGEELYMNDIENAIDEAVALNLISWLYDGVSYKKVVHE